MAGLIREEYQPNARGGIKVKEHYKTTRQGGLGKTHD